MSELATPEEYLRRPYGRVLVPDEDTGGYYAYMLEFPSCCSEGDSLEEAYANLEAAALGWIAICLDEGLPLPAPREAL